MPPASAKATLNEQVKADACGDGYGWTLREMVHPYSLSHGVITPSRGCLHPTAGSQRLPKRDRIRLPQVTPALEQSRLSSRHLPAVVHENPWITLPGPFVLVKPSNPITFAVRKPALCHTANNGTSVLAVNRGLGNTSSPNVNSANENVVQGLPADRPIPFTSPGMTSTMQDQCLPRFET